MLLCLETNKSAAVTTRAGNELDISKYKAWKLNRVVTKLQRSLDRFEDLRSDGSDRPPLLELGSDDRWRSGPDHGRFLAVSEPPGATTCPPCVAAPG